MLFMKLSLILSIYIIDASKAWLPWPVVSSCAVSTTMSRNPMQVTKHQCQINHMAEAAYATCPTVFPISVQGPTKHNAHCTAGIHF